MRSTTVSSAGSWALAILLGLLIWVSPDSRIYPSPVLAVTLVGLAILVLLAGAVMATFPRSAPRLPIKRQLAAVSPVVIVALALILAGRGLLPHPALPLALVLLGGGAFALWARRKPGGPATRHEEVGLGAALVVAGSIVIPALMLTIYGQTFWGIATPNYGKMLQRYEAVGPLAIAAPAARPGISPRAAGRALDAISATATIEWLPDSGPFIDWTADSVMKKAMHGLTTAERGWLERLGKGPRIALIDTVAYAASLDPWTGLTLPVPPEMNAFALPVLQTLPVRAAARGQLYRAALAIADRKPEVAESLARQVIGFGLRLRDDSDQLLGTLVGTAIAREAGMTLAVLMADKEGWVGAEAARGASVLPVAAAPTGSAEVPGPLELRRQLLDAAIVHSGPRSVTWDRVAILGVSPCTNLNELLYGPSPMLRAAYDANQPGPDASEEARAAYDVVRRGITVAGTDATVPALLWPMAWALGHDEAAACLAAAGTIQ